MDESIEDLAYSASVRAIEQQAQALANLRSRAGTVLAGASLVASFLGTPALRSGVNEGAVVVSLIALLGVLSLCALILWPYPFTFRLSAEVILRDHAMKPEPTDVKKLRGYLALVIERHHELNEAIISRLHNALAAALIGLGIETFALLGAVRPL
jgi:hypothetical protein